MPTFPGTITPVLRFDSAQPDYQDLANSVLAASLGDRVRSVPQPSPLSGSWVAPSDPERLSQGIGGLVCEPLALDYPTHSTQYLTAPAASINVNASTIALSFRPMALYGAPQQALLSFGGAWGLQLTGNGLFLTYNGGTSWDPGIRLGKDLNAGTLRGDNGSGNLVCVIGRYLSTGLDILVDEEGTVTQPSPLVAAIAGGTISGPLLGYTGNGFGNAIFGQGVIVNSAISDPDRASLMTYLKACGAPPAFPSAAPFVGIVGDSIAQGAAVQRPQSWAYRMLVNLRATYPTVRMLNAAIVGSGVVPATGNFSSQYDTIAAHLSGQPKGVIVYALGTNDMTSDPSNSGVDAALAIAYSTCDAMRSLGAKVAMVTPLSRGPALLGSTTQLQYNNARARWCASLIANTGVHFDALIDLRAVSGMGADGDWANTTNYASDQTHPLAPGHALLEPAYTAVVSALLGGIPPFNGKPNYQMHARSSANSRLYSWTASAPDRSGTGYASAGFPGSPLDIVSRR